MIESVAGVKECMRLSRIGLCGSDDKKSACNAGDQGLIPCLGRSPGGGNGSPLQYSCLGNPMGRGAWRATYSPQRDTADDSAQA